MAAILEAYRSGLLGRGHWLPNLISGTIVGVVALPLAMAFAIASGAKPEQGIYTAIVAGFIVSVFGGSRLQIAGPTGAFIVVLSGITAKHGIAGLQAATLMAGCILLLLGLAKLGTIIKFIPQPVIVGFTAGIGVIIWVGQWRDFFGLPAPAGQHFHEKLWHLLQSFPQLHLPTAGLAAGSILLVIFAPRLPGLKRVPGPLLALVTATALVSIFRWEGIRTIGSEFGGIPRGLPPISFPAISFESALELIGPAFAIAMLGAIESLLSAVVADGMAGTRHDSNRELVGQGIANILTPVFGGFAATGAIARTATNVRNGGTGPLSGIVHSATLLAIILFMAPLAADIPLAVLSAILFVVAWNMSEPHRFLKILRQAPRADVAILLVSFCLTVFADLVVAVNIGVILAMLQFLRRMAASVEVRRTTDGELEQELGNMGLAGMPAGLHVLTVDGPFFFGAVESLERALAGTQHDLRVLILRLRWVPFMDMTGLQTLEDVIRGLHKRGVRVLVVGANDRVRTKMENAGILELLGDGNAFADLPQALKSI